MQGCTKALFIKVLEALPQKFRTGCPWELLYADGLVITAESEEEENCCKLASDLFVPSLPRLIVTQIKPTSLRRRKDVVIDT